MPKEVLTQAEVEKLLMSINEAVSSRISPEARQVIDELFGTKSPKDRVVGYDYEGVREMISQEEIDALLNGVDGSEKQSKEPSPELETVHTAIQMGIQAAKNHLMQSMKFIGNESQMLLEYGRNRDDEDKSYQRLLGDHYTFLNECHAVLKQLDNLKSRENMLYKRKIELEGSDE